MLNKPLRITWKDEDGTTHVDVVKTQQAQEAKSKAIERWQEGFYKLNEEGRKLVEDAYNTEVNNSVKANFPEPDFDRFPGMATTWGGRELKLESYQKIGVMRSVKNSTLLGHAVGPAAAGFEIGFDFHGVVRERWGRANLAPALCSST